MTDITPDFNVCLKGLDAPPVLRAEHDITKINSFLQEAYSIVRRFTSSS